MVGKSSSTKPRLQPWPHSLSCSPSCIFQMSVLQLNAGVLLLSPNYNSLNTERESQHISYTQVSLKGTNHLQGHLFVDTINLIDFYYTS